MGKGNFVILKAEVEAQLKEIEGVYARLEERKRKRGAAAVESMGYQLHNLYCAFEDLFKIIADGFENHIQDKSKYHVELLKRMAVSIKGVRPALLSHESFILLDNLRAFRHFFRHAYSHELDARKVRIVLEDASRLKGIYQKEVNSFMDAF